MSGNLRSDKGEYVDGNKGGFNTCALFENF